MQDTSIKVTNDTGGTTEVYLTDLDVLVSEYIADLDAETLSKPTTYLGLLKHIYVTEFRPSAKQQFNANSVLINADPVEISKLWDWYVSLALKFGRTPTIAQFGVLTGIDRHTFQDWRDGSTRNASPIYSTTSSKMKSESEAFLESRAVESGSIGAIFALKACHNWRESAPVTAEIETRPVVDSPEEIAARHASAALKMPEKPDLD